MIVMAPSASLYTRLNAPPSDTRTELAGPNKPGMVGSHGTVG